MNPKNWIFTSWGKEINFKKFELCDFMICQLEICPTTQREHWQGYIEFKKEYKLYQVKSLFKEKGLNLSNATESRERNILYCSKENTYKGRRITYVDEEITIINDPPPSDWSNYNEMFSLNGDE